MFVKTFIIQIVKMAVFNNPELPASQLAYRPANV